MRTLTFDIQRFDQVITLTEGNDTYKTSDSNVSINALGGNDTVSNGYSTGNHLHVRGGSNVSISGGTGNDYILNADSSDVTINGGDDDDIIRNGWDTDFNFYTHGGDFVSIDGGAGNDDIDNRGSNVTINAGTGNDSITNLGDSVTISGGTGDDSIYNSSESVSIDAGAGNDSIEGYSKNSTIDAGDGDDYIHAGYNSTINAGDGDDYISAGSNSTIDAGDGDDYISAGDNSTINAGVGNDSIKNYGDNSTINAGAGDDSIFARGANSTINSGLGNDIVTLASNNLIEYAAGDGNDTVYGFNESDTITITGASYFTQTSGSDVIVTVGEGKIILKDVKGKSLHINKTGSTKLVTLTDNDDEFNGNLSDVTINGGAGNDSIDNEGDSVTINAGDGNDEISAGDNVSIDGGNGDDYINAGDNSTINGGDGNDEISSGGSNVTINAGDGNDSIGICGENLLVNGDDGDDYIGTEGCENATMNGGAGNDSIDNCSDNVTINAGDGNDTIFNYGSNVSISGGDGDDTIINEYGDNVTINGGAGDDQISLGSDDYDTTENTLIEYAAGDGNDVIEGFNETSTLQIGDGTGTYSKATVGNDIILTVGEGSVLLKDAASLSAVNIEGGYVNPLLIVGTGKADNITNTLNSATIQALDGNDSIENNEGSSVSINGGEGDDSISNNGGSNVSINGGAGDDYIYNYGDNVVDGGEGDDEILNEYWSSNVSIGGGAGKDTIYNYSESVTVDGGEGDDDIWNAGSNVSINGGAGDDDISNYVGSNVSINGGAGDDYIYNNGGSNVSINGGAGDDCIYNNGGSNVSISGGAGKDIIYNQATSRWNDEIGYETVTPDNATIDGGAGNDYIYNSDGNNVSIDGGAGNDLISLNSDAENVLIQYALGDGNDVIEGFNETSTLQIGDGTGTYSKATVGNDIIITVGEGSVLLKNAANLSATDIHIDGTFASVESEPELPAGISINNGKLEVSSNFKGKEVDANEFPVEIEVIDASDFKGKLAIIGNTANNTITGGKSNDTLTGNGGADTFALSSGKDVVTDYTAGVDKILVESTPSVTVNNKTGDTVIQVGKNSLTLKKLDVEDVSEGKKLTFTDGTNDTTRTYFSDKIVDGDSVTLQPAFKGTFDGANFAKVDASNAKVGVKIIGGDSSSVLGSSKNDTLLAKNSTLTGGKGKDVFIAESSATITDYESSDKISLGADISDVEIDDGNVVLSFDGKSLTIQNASDKKVTLLNGKKSTAYIFDNHAIFDGAKKAGTLTAGDEFDASSYSALVTIDASQIDGATITGNSKANKVSFGDGENVFMWAGGNDTLTNFGADDKLSITGAVTDATVTKKGDSVITVGKNKITVKNSSTVKFTDSSGTKIFDDGIFFDADKTSATLGSAVKDFDAADTEVTSITGNMKANKLYAGDISTTLDGGKGNDSLWGDAGADKFTYLKGDGKDVIFGFDDTDMLEIIGLGDQVSGTLNKAGTELTVKVGKTAVAVLKDFGSTTTFNINGNAYQLSGKALVQ